MPLQQQNGNGAGDEQSQEVLDEVLLRRFTVEPQALAPFQTGTLQWEVTAPRNPPVAVSIQLDGAAVATSGSLPVAPPQTSTYRLNARAGRCSKLLGQVTVVVELGACTTMEDSQVVKWVSGAVAQKIHERTDGVYLRSDPQVTIVPDQMKLHLSLGKKISVIGISADPTITIDASFGLAVVPGTPPATLHHPVVVVRPGALEFPPKLAPASKDISTDCSFPWYVWLVPGAMIGLPIAASGAEADAYRSADSMIDEIVEGLLNGFFQPPPNTYKHNVRLYVDAYGGEFAVTFCPVPEPVVKGEPNPA